MYLFMDVLFNQPRNAGSSTSLTTSIALVLNFPHPPSTLTNFLFMLFCFCSLSLWNGVYSQSVFSIPFTLRSGDFANSVSLQCFLRAWNGSLVDDFQFSFTCPLWSPFSTSDFLPGFLKVLSVRNGHLQYIIALVIRWSILDILLLLLGSSLLVISIGLNHLDFLMDRSIGSIKLCCLKGCRNGIQNRQINSTGKRKSLLE